MKSMLTDCRLILSLSNPDIQRLTSLSLTEVSALKDSLAEKYILKPFNVLDILNNKADSSLQHWKLSSFCKVIDISLRGGFLSGLITEISGESACGKTQLCLQLCISVQLNNEHPGGAVYICTEDAFPSKRLQQLIQCHSSKLPSCNLGDNIFIEHVADFETLEFCVNKKLPTLLKRGLVQLIVIDSVAALFRCHYDHTQTVERAKHLTKFASVLRHLAFQYNIPVICVNQVSANLSPPSGQSLVIPALGLTWSNQITSRIMLCKPYFTQGLEHLDTKSLKNNEPTHRKLRVIFAPHAPESEIDVYIDNTGIHGISRKVV
ncbi:DNA repair protein XRCC3-like isoform X2 [Physella acuta]|uniref:DNA repair protein XRCC3-like isoform X2 n=1 Tax=Physella acuta TaxID=109671 RepID=UPI0027DDCC72|nr:DNA repair protein XRCC3-like isoform X2 [Physella acuta]